MAAIERFLESREIRVPKKDENFVTRVVELLSDSQLESLIRQHKYAGRQTINYFIIKGISDYDIGDIREKIDSRLPGQELVSEIPKEPFLAEAEQISDRLYLAIGYYQNAGSEDPVTGRKKDVQITKRTVVVIRDDFDLVEIRGSDTRMVEQVRDEVCKSIGKYKPSTKRQPNLGPEFQDRFNDLVDYYFNLKVKVDDKDDETLDTIAFTSKEDEDGNRRDARESDRVKRELSESGSEITMGYVELSEGFRFRVNRDQAKLSFVKSEREENLVQVTDLVHNVLKQVGEYSQGQISGINDVPE
ncbi:hypothetical protein [Halobacterium salinarum]|uniref:hypothetical protein n=1 Tax=Halobacterium salinarum TaxID=2242 RepID=UPI00255679F5|nr:hypothetical protein [Halobacterium salinarum]